MLRVVALCVAVLSLPALGRADDTKKPGPPESPGKDRKASANLLIGKWVRTDQFQGTTLEYAKDGTYVTTSAPRLGVKPIVVGGTWKVEGERVVQTLGPSKTHASVTVTRLSETEFRFTNNAGREATYERVVEKKKK